MPTTPQANIETTLSILSDLVSFKSLPETPNGEIVSWIASYLDSHGIKSTCLEGPEGDRANLFATIGPVDQPGYILSGHTDVVPVKDQTWDSDPFILTGMGNGRHAGRGTTDMKGYLACILAMAPIFASLELKRPIHLAFSYDEEVGCRGVPHMIKKIPDLCAKPVGCIVGEPSDLVPVLSHKGKYAFEITFFGRSAHSSNPVKGENAIYPAADLILFARKLAANLEAEWPLDDRFTPAASTLVAGVVQGGSAVNIIPDQCSVRFEVRSVPGQTPKDIADLVIEKAKELVTHSKADDGCLEMSTRLLSQYPALAPTTDKTFISLMENISGCSFQQSVSYGTEAGLFDQAGIPSIICGPGSITRAHRPNEFITEDELSACTAMLGRLASACL